MYKYGMSEVHINGQSNRHRGRWLHETSLRTRRWDRSSNQCGYRFPPLSPHWRIYNLQLETDKRYFTDKSYRIRSARWTKLPKRWVTNIIVLPPCIEQKFSKIDDSAIGSMNDVGSSTTTSLDDVFANRKNALDLKRGHLIWHKTARHLLTLTAVAFHQLKDSQHSSSSRKKVGSYATSGPEFEDGFSILCEEDPWVASAHNHTFAQVKQWCQSPVPTVWSSHTLHLSLRHLRQISVSRTSFPGSQLGCFPPATWDICMDFGTDEWMHCEFDQDHRTSWIDRL